LAFPLSKSDISHISYIVKFWWIQCLNLLKAGWEVAYIHEVRFPRTFYKLRITKLGLQIRRQNTWPVLSPKPKSTYIIETFVALVSIKDPPPLRMYKLPTIYASVSSWFRPQNRNCPFAVSSALENSKKI
jgi:hypothetical protein